MYVGAEPDGVFHAYCDPDPAEMKPTALSASVFNCYHYFNCGDGTDGTDLGRCGATEPPPENCIEHTDPGTFQVAL